MSRLNPSIGHQRPAGQNSVKGIQYYLDGISKARDYYILSEAITLLESTQESHRELALDLLSRLYSKRTPSFRLGITGSPGVGKSTFIDGIASSFSENNHKVGILTIDPSSVTGQGSILGDKTRMETLISNPDIFIRPSPSSRHLGGLNRYTYEAMILCESTGMDRLLIETVGVGQSEVEVSENTDATILLILPGSGDSIQGIKKGILEEADLIIVHKADGAAQSLVKESVRGLKEALHLRRGTDQPEVLAYSSITFEGRDHVLSAMNKIIDKKTINLEQKRKAREGLWLKKKIQEEIHHMIAAQLEDHPDLSSSKVFATSNVFDIIRSFKSKINIQL